MSVFVSRAGFILLLLVLLFATWQVFTSPWLVWYSLAHTKPIVLLNTSRLNTAGSTIQLAPPLVAQRTSTLSRLRLLPQTLTARSLQQTLHTITLGRAPVQPVLIAGAPARTLEAIDDQIVAIATISAAEIRVGIGPTVAAASDQLRNRPTQSSTPVRQLNIVVPSFVLSTLPQAQYNGWNELLRQRLGLTRTTPDIIGYASQFDTTQFIINEGDIALSVTGAVDAFATTVEEWVQEDDRLQRPQEQSFTLPDGSIGVETVPGDIGEVLTPIRDGCRSPLRDSVSVWLCQSDQHATISNTEQLATTLPQDGSEWQISVSPKALEATFCQQPQALTTTLLCQATSIRASGFNSHASIVVVLSSQ